MFFTNLRFISDRNFCCTLILPLEFQNYMVLVYTFASIHKPNPVFFISILFKEFELSIFIWQVAWFCLETLAYLLLYPKQKHEYPLNRIIKTLPIALRVKVALSSCACWFKVQTNFVSRSKKTLQTIVFGFFSKTHPESSITLRKGSLFNDPVSEIFLVLWCL